MSKDHDQARLQDHVLSHVLILTGHHHHRLLAGDLLGNVVLVVAPVHLPRLQSGQALRPVPLVGVLDQVVHDGVGAAAVDQGALDDSLQHRVGGGDHAAPAGHPGGLHGVHPSKDTQTTTSVIRRWLIEIKAEERDDAERLLLAGLTDFL